MNYTAISLRDRLLQMWVTVTTREHGQTMAEYAILVVVIAIVVIAAAALLGGKISSVFSSLSGKI
jgi:pilus assembly protein Flp/PilA